MPKWLTFQNVVGVSAIGAFVWPVFTWLVPTDHGHPGTEFLRFLGAATPVPLGFLIAMPLAVCWGTTFYLKQRQIGPLVVQNTRLLTANHDSSHQLEGAQKLYRDEKEKWDQQNTKSLHEIQTLGLQLASRDHKVEDLTIQTKRDAELLVHKSNELASLTTALEVERKRIDSLVSEHAKELTNLAEENATLSSQLVATKADAHQTVTAHDLRLAEQDRVVAVQQQELNRLKAIERKAKEREIADAANDVPKFRWSPAERLAVEPTDYSVFGEARASLVVEWMRAKLSIAFQRTAVNSLMGLSVHVINKGPDWVADFDVQVVDAQSWDAKNDQFRQSRYIEPVTVLDGREIAPTSEVPSRWLVRTDSTSPKLHVGSETVHLLLWPASDPSDLQIWRLSIQLSYKASHTQIRDLSQKDKRVLPLAHIIVGWDLASNNVSLLGKRSASLGPLAT